MTVHAFEEIVFEVFAAQIKAGNANVHDLENFVEFFCSDPVFWGTTWDEAASKMHVEGKAWVN